MESTQVNNNQRFWKWLGGVLSMMLVTAVVALVSTIRQIEHIKTTQNLMGKEVDKNAQWIRDWYNELRVPERDQRQDSAIEELTRRLRVLEKQPSSEF